MRSVGRSTTDSTQPSSSCTWLTSTHARRTVIEVHRRIDADQTVATLKRLVAVPRSRSRARPLRNGARAEGERLGRLVPLRSCRSERISRVPLRRSARPILRSTMARFCSWPNSSRVAHAASDARVGAWALAREQEMRVDGFLNQPAEISGPSFPGRSPPCQAADVSDAQVRAVRSDVPCSRSGVRTNRRRLLVEQVPRWLRPR